MTKKVAFISAFATNNNTGMVSVELSSKNMCQYLLDNLNIKSDFFCVEREWLLRSKNESVISYNLLHDVSQLREYDSVVFWGDFLHSGRYQESDLRNRTKNSEIAEGILNGLFFDNDLVSKCITFGTTLYGNREHHESGAYRKNIGRFFSKMKLVMVRDAFSASYVSRYTDYKVNDSYGLDAAWLLHGVNVNSITEAEWLKNNKLGFSFGRELSKNPIEKERMEKAVNHACDQLKLSPVNIDWLSNNVPAVDDFYNKIRIIRECRLVITDTYHCAINCWREGVPALVIGRGADNRKNSHNEKKKEMIFQSFNAQHYYLFYEDISTCSLDKVFQCCVSPKLRKRFLDDVHQAVSYNFNRLATAITD